MDNDIKGTKGYAAGHPLYNADLAPIAAKDRTWGTWNYIALWISMSISITTFMLGGALIDGGMNWWQAVTTIFLGNVIVLIPMLLNGRVGAAYGIPFPVFMRSSFGVFGANIPAILRAIVACGWFSIQTWIGGDAIFIVLRAWVPSIDHLPQLFPAGIGLQTGQAISFLFFWLVNMYFIHKGIGSIKKLLIFKAFFLPVAALLLLCWAVSGSHGFGPILSLPSRFTSSSDFWAFFFPALTGIIGYWATMSLNIPDFTRYAKDQRSQMIGQAIALPAAMTFFSFFSIIIISSTIIIYGKDLWYPLEIANYCNNRMLITFIMICIAIATLAANIAANIVSPANDIANLAPSKLDFQKGGYITGVIGLLIFPWKLIALPHDYIYRWLIAYSSLLGPIAGIMIVDYYFIRRQIINVKELYEINGLYTYTKGFNMLAIVALLAGIIPNIPGFLTEIQVIGKDAVPGWISQLYHYAWFVGFLISGLVYYLTMKIKKANKNARTIVEHKI